MLHTEIDKHIADAMKAHDDVRLAVLRSIKTEFVRKEKDGVKLDEKTEASILTKMVAQREDSINQFMSANRFDLVEVEGREMEVLKEYAPKEVSEADIIAKTEEVIASLGDGYVLSMKDMKSIMSKVQETYPTANGKTISMVIKNKIG